MRVLLVSFPEPGHSSPMLALAQRLEAAGHTPAIFSLREDLTPRARMVGLRCRCEHVRQGDPRTATAPRKDRGVLFLQLVRSPAAYLRWMQYGLIDMVDLQLEELRATIQDFRPDVIATDPMAYAGAIAAERERIPWAALSPVLVALAPPSWRCDFVDILAGAKMQAWRQQLCARHGVRLDFCVGDAVSPWLNTVPTSELHFPRTLSGNRHSVYAGPCLLRQRGDEDRRAFPWDRLRADRPKVYVACGTQLAFSDDLLVRLDQAIADVAQLVIARGAGPGTDALPLSSDTIVVPRAPQLDLLAQVDAVVSHGGANSTMETMQAGRPLCVIPLGHDQPIQAMLTEVRGAGHSAPPTASVAELRAAIAPLLRPDAPEREICARIAGSLGGPSSGGEAVGAERIVALLERLHARGEPIRAAAPTME